jgi:hypothetical protein
MGPAMPNRLRVALLVALAAVPLAAHGQTVQGTMCGKFFPTAYGCTGGSSYVEARSFDKTVSVYTADSSTKLTKLVVYFHGHGGTPTGNTDLLVTAAELGYDVITLDYDYSRDYTQPASPLPIDAACGGGTCNMSIDAVCGCYTDCYGYRNNSVWNGGNYVGLPTVHADWSVNKRLNKVVSWMVNNTGYARFSNYLDPAQRGGINWSRVTVVGHSLGSDLAGYIGKWQSVERVVVLSGPAGKLAPDSSDLVSWGTAYGCSNSSSAGCGPGTAFPGCSCTPTTFNFGVQNGIGTCSLSSAPVGWVADNHFGGNTGYSWQTSNDRYYGLADTDDNVANWTAPMTISMQRNWLAIDLDSRHDPGYADGWNDVGDCDAPGSLQSGNWHGVISRAADGSVSQICCANNATGHRATVSDDACPMYGGGPISLAAVNRWGVWQFMLTN